jgi:radical SAM protein with 4Fe4S-binding SPASM domain
MFFEKELKKRLPAPVIKFLRRAYLKAIWLLYGAKYFIQYGHTDFFSDLNIELNTSCNRRCIYCPNVVYERGLIKNEKLMEEGVFNKIIDELAEIKFTGRISPQFFGEPLLDKRLVRFMEYARKKLPRATLVVISNGDYLTVELFNKLLEVGVNRFLLTQHDETMPINMRQLFSYLHRFPEHKIKVNLLHFNENTPLFNRGGTVKPKVEINFPRCSYPGNPLVIDYAGDVVLCCNDYLKNVVFGNVKFQKLTDIWFSSKYKGMRKQLRNMELSLPICKSCVGIQDK